MRVGAELRHDMSPSVTSEDQPGCSVGGRGGLGSFRSEVMEALVWVGAVDSGQQCLWRCG